MFTRTMSIVLILSTTLAQAGGIEVSVMKPSHLAALRLMHENGSFSVEREGRTVVIPSRDVSRPIRAISSEKLAQFVATAGYLSVHQYDNGEFSIREHVRGPGGGIALGTAVYWGVKSTLYGVLGGAAVATAAGAGAAAAGAAGATAVGAGVAKVIAGAPIAIAAKTLIVAAGAAGNIAAAASVAGGVAAPVIAPVVVSVAATGGGFGIIIAGIEGISAAAGIACGMLPTP